MQTFEALCANAEAVAIEIENLAKQLQRSAHAMKKAAHEGSPGKIRQAASQIDEAVSKTRHIEATANRAWPLSDEELTGMLNGPYVDQLIDAAGAVGLSLNRLDECLAAFPVILQVLPGQRAVAIGFRANDDASSVSGRRANSCKNEEATQPTGEVHRSSLQSLSIGSR